MKKFIPFAKAGMTDQYFLTELVKYCKSTGMEGVVEIAGIYALSQQFGNGSVRDSINTNGADLDNDMGLRLFKILMNAYDVVYQFTKYINLIETYLGVIKCKKTLNSKVFLVCYLHDIDSRESSNLDIKSVTTSDIELLLHEKRLFEDIPEYIKLEDTSDFPIEIIGGSLEKTLMHIVLNELPEPYYKLVHPNET